MKETPQEKIERLKDEMEVLLHDYNEVGMEITCLEGEIERMEEEIENGR